MAGDIQEDQNFYNDFLSSSEDEWEVDLDAFLFNDNVHIEDNEFNQNWELDLDAFLFDDEEFFEGDVADAKVHESAYVDDRIRVDPFQFRSDHYYIFTKEVGQYMVKCLKEGPTCANPYTILSLQDQSFVLQGQDGIEVWHRKVLKKWRRLEDGLIDWPHSNGVE